MPGCAASPYRRAVAGSSLTCGGVARRRDVPDVPEQGVSPMIEKESQFWAESWDRHASDYFTTPPHLGPCLELLFPDKSWTYLEMGGGTMRDARYLAQTGRSVTGSDSVEEV